MNAQYTQNLQICMQSEVSYLCDSSVDRFLGSIVKLINGFRNYYANRTLTAFLTRMSPKLLRDIGLDDPQVQMSLFESNFNTEADLRELNQNRYLIR
jgi:uncharacterized protein YjiS (DUF1127 family)